MTGVSRSVLYLYMIGMIVFGTSNTIILKTIANECDFAHPYFMGAVMFLGELMCLLFYYFLPLQSAEQDPLLPKAGNKLYEKYGKALFMIPALCDLIGSTLSGIGLILSAPSVYSMLRGSIILVVALYSIVFLKRKLFRHQWLGVILTTAGLTIIGLVSVKYKAKSASDPLIGTVLLLASQLFSGGMFVIEEILLKGIDIHPLQAVGIEGLSGLCCLAVILPILNLIPCDSKDFCEFGYFENSVHAITQMEENAVIIILMILCMVSIALFNWTGIATTKYASSLARSIVDSSRTLFIWVISMLIRWEKFSWLEFAGFLVLGVGSLIYNEIVVLPVLGLKESVERSREYRRED